MNNFFFCGGHYSPQNENETLDNVSIAHFKGKKKQLLTKMLPNIYEKNIFDLIFDNDKK